MPGGLISFEKTSLPLMLPSSQSVQPKQNAWTHSRGGSWKPLIMRLKMVSHLSIGLDLETGIVTCEL